MSECMTAHLHVGAIDAAIKCPSLYRGEAYDAP